MGGLYKQTQTVYCRPPDHTSFPITSPHSTYSLVCSALRRFDDLLPTPTPKSVTALHRVFRRDLVRIHPTCTLPYFVLSYPILLSSVDILLLCILLCHTTNTIPHLLLSIFIFYRRRPVLQSTVRREDDKQLRLENTLTDTLLSKFSNSTAD